MICFFCKQAINPATHRCWSAPKDPRGFEFWADGLQFFTEHPSLSVVCLKVVCGAAANRNCHQEHPVEAFLHDSASVDLTGCPRFLFIPPACY